MKAQVKLEFQGFEPSSHVRALVESGIQKVEARSGRIHACRITVRAPGPHHRSGEAYTVSIRLGLADGRVVSVGSRAAGSDPRKVDVAFAITDSFRRAMRQLHEQTHRLQGHIKRREKLQRQGGKS